MGSAPTATAGWSWTSFARRRTSRRWCRRRRSRSSRRHGRRRRRAPRRPSSAAAGTSSTRCARTVRPRRQRALLVGRASHRHGPPHRPRRRQSRWTRSRTATSTSPASALRCPLDRLGPGPSGRRSGGSGAHAVDYYGFDTTERRSTTRASDWPSRRPSTGAGWQSSTTRPRRPCHGHGPGRIPGRPNGDFLPAYDPDGARSLLAEAGYPTGAGFPGHPHRLRWRLRRSGRAAAAR